MFVLIPQNTYFWLAKLNARIERTLLAVEPRQSKFMAKSGYSNEEIAQVISSGRYKEIVGHRNNLIVQLKNREDDQVNNAPLTSISPETGEVFFESELLNTSKHLYRDVDMALKLVQRRKKALKNFNKRFKSAFKIAKKLYHLTLPFALNFKVALSIKKMRQEVYSFLKSFGDDVLFFGTIGVGKGGGIHFHIIIDRKIDKKAWKYSSYVGQREVLNEKVQIIKMAKYLTKNHLYSRVDPSITSRVIFSRSKKSPLIWGNTYNTENTVNQPKTIPFYNIQHWINNINSNKQHPIYHDMY